jgi:hypothetical protein
LQRTEPQPKISLVVATVHSEREYHAAQSGTEAVSVVLTPPGVLRQGLRIVLSAMLRDGGTVTAGKAFGIDGSLDISRAEVREQIDRMLGRRAAADTHHPPILAWGPLRAALEGAGVTSSESELIETALEVRFEPSADPQH